MLVLLIVFMITAPLLTTGVPIDLPKTQARALKGESDPLVVTINNNGKIFLQDAEINQGQLLARLAGLAQEDDKRRVYVRGDRGVNYGQVMGVMGAINAAGFVHVALVTEPIDGKLGDEKLGGMRKNKREKIIIGETRSALKRALFSFCLSAVAID